VGASTSCTSIGRGARASWPVPLVPLTTRTRPAYMKFSGCGRGSAPAAGPPSSGRAHRQTAWVHQALTSSPRHCKGFQALRPEPVNAVWLGRVAAVPPGRWRRGREAAEVSRAKRWAWLQAKAAARTTPGTVRGARMGRACSKRLRRSCSAHRPWTASQRLAPATAAMTALAALKPAMARAKRGSKPGGTPKPVAGCGVRARLGPGGRQRRKAEPPPHFSEAGLVAGKSTRVSEGDGEEAQTHLRCSPAQAVQSCGLPHHRSTPYIREPGRCPGCAWNPDQCSKPAGLTVPSPGPTRGTGRGLACTTAPHCRGFGRARGGPGSWNTARQEPPAASVVSAKASEHVNCSADCEVASRELLRMASGGYPGGRKRGTRCRAQRSNYLGD